MRRLLTVMNYDKKSADFWYDFETKTVEYKCYPMNDRPLFGKNDKPDWRDFEVFIESRCVTRYRKNIDELLDLMGLMVYDPWAIVKRTRGRVHRDHRWLKFGDEDKITWEEVSSRGYYDQHKFIDSITDEKAGIFTLPSDDDWGRPFNRH